MVMNQWCNVMRWEKATRPFLRTSEFLWQEGHTVQASKKEAEEDAQKMLDIYIKMSKDLLAIPMLSGQKSEREKFAGAVATYGIEAVLRDGKCLQSGTTHDLGTNFAKAADIKFLNKNGEWEYGYSTSWGISTRLIGAVIMVHGDERGIKLPPKIAPTQVVLVPVAMHKQGVLEKVNEVAERLKNAGIRVFVDDTDASPGWKFNQWEMKGVPLRIEIGPRDIENNNAVLVRRDTHEKIFVLQYDIEQTVVELLDDIQINMYNISKEYVDKSTRSVNTVQELVDCVAEKHVGIASHCGDIDCEQALKDETGIRSRVILPGKCNDEKCIRCGKKAKYRAYFAKQY